jgi:hypothetical protein
MRRLFNAAGLLMIILVLSSRQGYSQCLAGEKIKYAEEVRNAGISSIEEEIKTVNLLNNLGLGKEQLEFILLQAKEIEQTRRAVYSEFDRYAGEMRQVETKIDRQVDSGRTTLDKKVEIGYYKVKKQCDALFYKLNGRILGGIKAVEGQLKDFQLVALDGYVPCIIPLVGDNFIGGKNKSARLGYILFLARVIPEEKFKLTKESFVESKIAELKTSLPTCKKLCDENIAREEILKSVQRARQMDEADFKLLGDKLALELEQKIILVEPDLSRQEKIQRFLLSRQSIPILEKRLRQKNKYEILGSYPRI